MLSLVSGARKRFGFDDPDAPKLTVRICRADDRKVVITPACSAEGVSLVERQLRHVRWRGLPADAVITAVFDARLGHPRLLVNNAPDREDILDELGPVMYELMRDLVDAVRGLPDAHEFQEAVVESSSMNLRAAVASGSGEFLRPGARRVSAVCRSCGRPAVAAPALSLLGLNAPVTCSNHFLPFVQEVYEAMGGEVLRKVEGAQMRRLRQDLDPVLAALDAYPTDMFEGDGSPTVADEPVLDGSSGEPSQPFDGGVQVFVVQF